MRFLVDECTGPVVATWLRSLGHEVFSVFDDARGAEDYWILAKAVQQRFVIISNEKDFGEMVYRGGLRHCGVVLLRLKDERASQKIAVLSALLANHGEAIAGSFVVATERRVRIERQSEG